MSPEKKFRKAVELIIGEKPSNMEVYQLAFRHTSASKETNIKGFRESNERLEFLGDSVLGMVIAEYLFKKFPYKDEGFLTEIRSRIVNRETLNGIARKIGLDRLIEFDGNRKGMPPNSSMYGDALEALVGAVYLDKGFRFTRKFITKELLTHYDLDALINNNANFKSRLIEWAQREGKEVRFMIVEEKGSRHFREFISQVILNGEVFAQGSGYSKKKAEQSAAEKACEQLELK
ncbi:ribonuclease III [Runella rosea]|uniref:Ribonuclease 3 n=3 Tax=Runella TaxID=105 RepID=A0A344TSP7_9BACT|nr:MULTISPECIES: ribonuclease III [Runella]AXE21668.1 ribonuclease III [Runella rosea]MCP1384984.1 ribonuclease III [Runella salmonicolor]RDB06240.1 ribonuclease III [Runella aurantiaca]